MPGTAAEAARLAETSRIEEQAQLAWARHASKVRGQIAEKQFSQARRTLKRFQLPKSLESQATSLEDEIDAAEQLAGEETRGDPSVDLLAAALAPILAAWSTAESERLVDKQISELRFTLQLESEEKRILDVARELMGELPDFLDTLGTSLDPSPVTLDLTTLAGETTTYEVTKFSSQEIFATEPEARAGTVLKWRDLNPESRLRILRSSAGFTPDQFALYGWFAFANGDRTLANQIWRSAPESSKEDIDGLRRLADRVAATND